MFTMSLAIARLAICAPLIARMASAAANDPRISRPGPGPQLGVEPVGIAATFMGRVKSVKLRTHPELRALKFRIYRKRAPRGAPFSRSANQPRSCAA
jgi:hypothetical protein